MICRTEGGGTRIALQIVENEQEMRELES